MRHFAIAIALTMAQDPAPPEFKPFPVETKLDGASTRSLFGFVDVPENFESRLKTFADEKRHRDVVTVPGTGEATLYILWGAHRPRSDIAGLVRVAIDRRERIVRASLPGPWPMSDRIDPTNKDKVQGRGVRLGPLEQGGWTVLIVEGGSRRDEEILGKSENTTTTVVKFLAGPGGPKPEGKPLERKREDDLPAFLTWPGARAQHDCAAFVCREAEFDAARADALGEKGGVKSAPFKGDEELVLYVLWGRRIAWPDASAVFDSKSNRFLVSARWVGAVGGMKEVLTSPYAGYGFRLGALKPGDYSVEVSELLPAKSEEPTVTRRLAFRVEKP